MNGGPGPAPECINAPPLVPALQMCRKDSDNVIDLVNSPSYNSISETLLELNMPSKLETKKIQDVIEKGTIFREPRTGIGTSKKGDANRLIVAEKGKRLILSEDMTKKTVRSVVSDEKSNEPEPTTTSVRRIISRLRTSARKPGNRRKKRLKHRVKAFISDEKSNEPDSPVYGRNRTRNASGRGRSGKKYNYL